MALPAVKDWLVALTPFQGLGLALALGLLIGIERGWSQRLERDGSRVAGIRTFALLGLAGGLAGEAAHLISPIVSAILVAAAAAAMLIGYARTSNQGEVSATTTVVGLITLGIGVFAASGQGVIASVLAATTTLILSLRSQLHRWIGEVSEAELHAIARFGLIALAILPLLPDAAFGPFDAWNPRQIWMVVVLVSGLSLAGYAATKRLGASRGLLATAAAGAIVSSTAVTATLAARLRDNQGSARTLTAAIALASVVMFLRVLVLVALLAPSALPALSIVVLPALAVSAICAAWGLRDQGSEDAQPTKLRNPFDIAPAFILAGLVMVTSLVGRWALARYGDAGLLTVLGISGMLDVDSAIITASGLPPGRLDATTAGMIFAAPMLLNSLVKAGLVIVIAGGRAGLRAATVLIVTVAVGVAAAAALPLIAAT